MNWYIEKTTANERTVINNAMYSLFDDLERAEVLLSTVLEEYFGDRHQKPLTESDAEWTRNMLHIVQNILSDTIVSYYLTVADTENLMARNYMKAAESVKTAIQCGKAFDDVYEMEKGLATEKRRSFIEARKRIGDMDDEAAIQALHALLEDTVEND